MTLLLNPLRTPGRTTRVALRPGLDSSSAIAAVGRFDGRTRIVGVRDEQGWRRGDRSPWTQVSAERMRVGPVTEVLLRRRFRRARVLLAWVPARTAKL